MKELTKEQSIESAKPIKEMAELARKLDVEYLTECVKQMKEQHSFRESAMVLNPNPFTAMEHGDLEAAKIKGLELMIALAENQNIIFEKTVALQRAKMQSNDLSKMFGL